MINVNDSGFTSNGIDPPSKPNLPPRLVLESTLAKEPDVARDVERNKPKEVPPLKYEQTQKVTQVKSKIEQNSYKISENLEQVVSRINQYMQSLARELEFNIDQDSGQTIVKVIDKSTNEVIRQLPPDEAFEIAKDLDNAAGKFLDTEV